MRKVVISGMLGNGLEWYDFALYGQMAIHIGHMFFPDYSPTAQVIATFGVFAVGFLMRPLGAIIFGYIGDRYGRQTSLVIAILMMAIPTGLIGVLPTYETIGIMAPILLTVIRIFQGLSLGGEFSGSIIYIVEHAPDKKRGLAGSASIISLVLGFLLGTVVALATIKLLPEEDFNSWGWRVPFLFGIVIGLVGFYIRRKCDESPAFEAARAEGALSKKPVREALFGHGREMIQAFAFYMTVTMPFYLASIYFISYTQLHLHRSTEEAFAINFTAMVGMLFGMYFGATWSDKKGRKAVMVPAAAIILITIYPVLLTMGGSGFWGILLLQVYFATILGIYCGPVPALLVELFPTSVRYTGMAIAYNLAATIFGGTAPMVCEWLISVSGTPLSIAYYVMLCCIISLGAFYTYRDRWQEKLA